jgi:NTE family protein
MLFHLGVLWRLNDAGYLPRLTRISSVSAGSITAGVLALSWPRLALRDGVAQRFGPQVVVPVRRLAGVTVDLWAVVHGVLWRSARTIWLTGEFAPMSRPTPNADSVMGRVSL